MGGILLDFLCFRESCSASVFDSTVCFIYTQIAKPVLSFRKRRKSPVDKAKFLENLRSARKSRRLTQSQVAEALGVSDKAYSKWETGENDPDIDTLCRLAEFYGSSPAAFFREEDDSPLDGMNAGEAAQLCYRRINDLLFGLRSCTYPPVNEPEEPLPIPEMPKELRMPEADRSIWEYAWRDLFALSAAGPDMNLTLLAMPHAEHYGWLLTEGEAMEELFRFLGLPGAVRCIHAMLTERQMSFFSPAYLAKKAGVTEAEAAAVLERGQQWQLTAALHCVDRNGTAILYQSGLRVRLLGLLCLGRLMLAQDYTRNEMRGTIISGSGNLTIPKGGTV